MAEGESRWAKEWRRISRRPRAVTFAELEHLLRLAGFVLARTSGSHHTYSRGGETVTVPYRRPHVLPVYVRDVLARTAPPQEPEGED